MLEYIKENLPENFNEIIRIPKHYESDSTILSNFVVSKILTNKDFYNVPSLIHQENKVKSIYYGKTIHQYIPNVDINPNEAV